MAGYNVPGWFSAAKYFYGLNYKKSCHDNYSWRLKNLCNSSVHVNDRPSSYKNSYCRHHLDVG